MEFVVGLPPLKYVAAWAGLEFLFGLFLEIFRAAGAGFRQLILRLTGITGDVIL